MVNEKIENQSEVLSVAAEANKRPKLTETQLIVYTAMFTAFSTICNAVTIPATFNGASVFISFLPLVCFLTAWYLGPIPATAAGFLGDLIAGILWPKGAYLPLIGLASALWGLIPGLVFMFKGNKYVKVIIANVLCTIICTAGLNTYAVWFAFASATRTFWAYLFVRLPFQGLITVANAAIMCAYLVFDPKIRRVIFKPE